MKHSLTFEKDGKRRNVAMVNSYHPKRRADVKRFERLLIRGIKIYAEQGNAELDQLRAEWRQSLMRLDRRREPRPFFYFWRLNGSGQFVALCNSYILRRI